jgi:hypothetical protein
VAFTPQEEAQLRQLLTASNRLSQNHPTVQQILNDASSFHGTSTLFQQSFSNATFSGEFDAIELKISDTCSVVSFWGYANQNAGGSSGQSFVLVSPSQYQLLSRFVGQVDQFAIGYNAGTNDFKYVPLRITAGAGVEIVTAPNITVGTRFSFQFMLILSTAV